MDAAAMTFADESFEFVYSMAVFQHLEDPAAVLDEMIRVLTPGGGLYLDFILYTSPYGSHDARLFDGSEDALPAWAHLQPELQPFVRPNAHLNRLRLPEWRALCEDRMPGSEILLIEASGRGLADEARTLRQQVLRDYALDELTTSKVIVLWRKP